jgi:hypothetical protein
MTHSETLAALAAALSAAQAEFEAVSKDSTNPFFKSKYADLPSVVAAASPILATHGLAVSQLPGHDEGGDTLTTMLLHSSGEFLSGTMRLRPVKSDPQAQGAAMTYGRRYSYMAILGLVADDDDDGTAASAPRSEKPAAKTSKPAASKTPAEPKAGAGAATAGGPVLAHLRKLAGTAKKSPEWMSMKLVELGVEGDTSDLKAVMPTISLDVAAQLAEALGGSIEDVK